MYVIIGQRIAYLGNIQILARIMCAHFVTVEKYKHYSNIFFVNDFVPRIGWRANAFKALLQLDLNASGIIDVLLLS